MIDFITPSMGRADNVLTTKIESGIILYVPEDEVEAYKYYNPDNDVVGVPKEYDNIVKTRQYMLDRHKDMFFLDDDIDGIQNFGAGNIMVREDGFLRKRVEFLADISRQAGVYMFGFGSKTTPMQYSDIRPIEMTGYINASYCGFLEGHGLKYDLSYIEGEDYYISCLNLYKHRKMFIDNRYRPNTVGNFTAKGGCQLYRTSKVMRDTTKKLMLDFGDTIVEKTPNAGKKNLREYERSLRCKI